MMRSLVALVVLAALFCVGEVVGEAYYVSPFGSDVFNSGTSAWEPFKTIGKAASVVKAGDKIHLEDGSYEGPENWASFDKSIKIEANNQGLVLIVGDGTNSHVPCMNFSVGGNEIPQDTDTDTDTNTYDDDSDGYDDYDSTGSFRRRGRVSDDGSSDDDHDFQLVGIQFHNCLIGLSVDVVADSTNTVGIDTCVFSDSPVALDLNPQSHTLHELKIIDTKFDNSSIRARDSEFFVKNFHLDNCEVEGNINLNTFSADLIFDSCNLAFGAFTGVSHGNGKISFKDSYFTNYSVDISNNEARSSSDQMDISSSTFVATQIQFSGPFSIDKSKFTESNLALLNASGEIESSNFREKKIDSDSCISLKFGSWVKISDSSIDFNDNSGSSGGGMAVFNSHVHLDKTSMYQNQALDGGAIYLKSASAEIENSHFTSNSASQQGGVILCSNSSLLLNDNVFSENFSPEGAVVSCLSCDIDPSSHNNEKNHNVVDDGECAPY